MRNTYTVHTYPGVPHSDEDVVKELLDLLVEQGWGVDGKLSKDQHLHGGVKIFALQNIHNCMQQFSVLSNCRTLKWYVARESVTMMLGWEGLQ